VEPAIVSTHVTAADAGYRALWQGAALHRPPLGAIRVSGADRATFLQGMVTADVRRVTPAAGAPAFFLDIKGRILAELRLLASLDELLIALEAAEVQAVGEDLASHVIAEAVDLDDAGVEHVWLALEGPSSEAILAQIGIPLPGGAQLACSTAAGSWIARATWSGRPGVWMLVEHRRANQLTESLCAAGAVLASPQAVEIVRIEQGIPRHRQDFGAGWLVQETGLDAHVAINKGCYRGQETVERVRARGMVQRALVGLTWTGASLAPGTPLTAGQDQRAVGEISSSGRSPRCAAMLGLGWVRRSHLAIGQVLYAGSVAVTLAARPFSLEILATQEHGSC
jgi:folate-binding protein YgfZ